MNSLTSENINDLEGVQKSAIKLILQDRFKGYKQGLAILGLEDLSTRRENVCLEFAKKCIKSENLCHMFPKYWKIKKFSNYIHAKSAQRR